MLNVTPVGQERLFIPVNPVQHREVHSIAQHNEPRRIEPLAPARAVSDQHGRNSNERFYLLSAETRRSLLNLDPELPLIGPRPTD